MHFKINSKNLDNINRTYTPKDKGDLINTIIEICKKDKEDIVDLNLIDTSKIIDMSYVFCNEAIQFQLNGRNIDISEWDVSNVTSFENCFEKFYGFDCDLKDWDVSNCKYFRSMFNNCTVFKGTGLEYWNMNNALNISCMFFKCSKLDVDLSNWDLLNISTLDQYKYIFDECKLLDDNKKPKTKNGKKIK